MIKITAKGLAKFMTSGPASQRTVLRDFKFPRSPEARAQTLYYAEARGGIRQYHENNNRPSTIVRIAEQLKGKMERATGPSRTRLGHNVRALESYLENFASSQFRILKSPALKYLHANVNVNASPDLLVAEDGREKLIKLDLAADAADETLIRIVLQVMYEAAVAAGLRVAPRDVIYLDISRGILHRGARARARLRRDIDAACENIAAMWEGITKSRD